MLEHKSKIKFTAYVAASIDGVIAQNSKISNTWASKEDTIFFQRALKEHDIFIVGHSTYKNAKARLDKRNTVVFTSKVKAPKKVGPVLFFNPAYSSFLAFIKKNKYKKPAILGGPRVYGYFIESGLLNELFITLEPYIFTNGVQMFKGKAFKKHNLKLVWTKKLNKNGTLLLKYTHAS